MNADRFLESTNARFARNYFAAIHDLYVAKVRQNRPAARSARLRLASVIAETMGAAEIVGAESMLREVAKSAKFAAEQTVIPNVTLTEALDQFVERTPVTIRNAAERTAQRIAQLYSQEKVMAFALAAEETVTAEASKFVDRAFREGLAENEAGRRITMAVEEVRELSGPWSEGYSRMVFRTNANTAVTAGRFRIAQDPDIKAVAPAFKFDAVGDSDTRHNHAAMDGVIMSVDDTRWNKLASPLGYNCRCQLRAVSVVELEAMNRLREDGSVVASPIPAAAGPDPGFRHGGRPDLFVNAQ